MGVNFMNNRNYQAFLFHLNSILQSNHIIPRTKKYVFYYRRLYLYRRITEFVIITLLQYTGLTLGTIHYEAIPLWPASGVAVAMVFFRGERIWPGLFFGSVLAYWVNHVPLGVSLLASALHLLEALMIKRCTHKIIGAFLPVQHAASILKFYLVSAGISFVISGTLLALINPDAFWPHLIISQWLTLWLANFGGIVVFAPACLIWDRCRSNWSVQLKTAFNPILSYLLIFLLIGLNFLLFMRHPSETFFYLNFLTIPLTINLGISYGQYGVTLASVLTAMMGVCNLNNNFAIYHLSINHVFFIALQCKYILESGITFYLITRWAKYRHEY